MSTEPGWINDRWELQLTPDRVTFHADRPTWEKERLDAVYNLARPGMVVYDIGAECGDFTALYRTWVGDDVVAIEPQPAYWPAIKAHWEDNTHLPEVTAETPEITAGRKVPLGFVGFAAATTEIVPPNTDIVGPLAPVAGAWPDCAYGKIKPDFGFRHLAQQTATTPRIELDNLAVEMQKAPDGIRQPPDMFCIDVEGAELQVLFGARRLLDETHPLVFVSASPDTMQDWYGQSLDDMHDWMDGFGYRHTLLGETHEQFWLYE